MVLNYIKGIVAKQNNFYVNTNAKQKTILLIVYTAYLLIFSSLITTGHLATQFVNIMLFTIGFGLLEEALTKKLVGKPVFHFFQYLLVYSTLGLLIVAIVFFIKIIK